MIQEYGGKPIAAQRPFMSQVGRIPGISVFPHYIKRNDTVFSAAPQFGVPPVILAYSSGSHKSVVEGLEEVSDEVELELGL